MRRQDGEGKWCQLPEEPAALPLPRVLASDPPPPSWRSLIAHRIAAGIDVMPIAELLNCSRRVLLATESAHENDTHPAPKYIADAYVQVLTGGAK